MRYIYGKTGSSASLSNCKRFYIFDMIFKKAIAKGGALLLLSAVSFLFSFETRANLQGKWIQHPGSALRSYFQQSQVHRIIEGNKYVYFCVRGHFFSRERSGYVNSYPTYNNIDPLQLFRYDKSQPWEDVNIRPVAADLDLSGHIVDVLNYSAALGVMVVIYDDGALDIIYDNNDIINSKAFKDIIDPYNRPRPYSVTFDEERSQAYIAASIGIVTLDLKTGEMLSITKTDKNVAWAGRVGDHMVIFAGSISPSVYSGGYSEWIYDTQAYVYPLGNVPAVLVDPIDSSKNLEVLMPLSPTSFAALAPGTSENINTLKLFTIGVDRDITASSILENVTMDEGGADTRYRHMFRTDGFSQNVKDGFVIHSIDEEIFLSKDLTDASGLRRISKSGLSSVAERKSKCATLDGSKLWLYTYDNNGRLNTSKRGFYSYNNKNNFWTNKSEIAAPNAPTSFILAYGDWNPEYGLLTRTVGTRFNNAEYDIDRLSGYKNGRWTDYSYSATNPSYVVPTERAGQLKSDPINPNWIWGSSSWSGLFRVDLEDSSNFLEFGTEKYSSYQNSYPGYFSIFQSQPVWDAVLYVTNVDFDMEDNLWFIRNVYATAEDLKSEYMETAYIPIYYLTAEERQQIAKIGNDKSKLPDILGRELRVPRTSNGTQSKLLVLKTEKNKNYLVTTHCEGRKEYRYSVIYDHNGTPDNPEDDRYALFDDIYDEEGLKVHYLWESGLYEDPLNGNLWLLTSAGPLIFNPSEVLNGNKTCRRLKITRRDGMEVNENPFEFIDIYYISDDVFGRKWLASSQGLFCLSSDAQEILGHYTKDNSQLPSDEVWNVVCSPDGAVFAMTSKGLAEFRPDGNSSQTEASTHLSIWPANVTPHYKGYVNISGAIGSSEYVVSDKEGNTVKSLGVPENGVLQWDAKDSEGNSLAPGKYNIHRLNIEETHIINVL